MTVGDISISDDKQALVSSGSWQSPEARVRVSGSASAKALFFTKPSFVDRGRASAWHGGTETCA